MLRAKTGETVFVLRDFRFSAALRPQKPWGVLGTGSPGRSVAGAATSIIFVATNTSLEKHNFVATNIGLSPDKCFVATNIGFVATNDVLVSTSRLLSQKRCACETKVLSRQACFCRDKRRVLS